LLNDSMLRLILGGAALQRCSGRTDLNAAFAAEVTVSARESVIARTSPAVIVLALLLSPCAFAQSAPDIYKAHCSACHGVNGAGDTMLGKNLKLRPLGSAEVQKQSDEELASIISKGKSRNRMPAFERKLSKDQIATLVRYIRSLKK
jgi:cytochrome c553